MDSMLVILAFCFGLVFGSFFNVVVYRLPRGLSLVKPGSHCPRCGHRLSAVELIPVFSYLWQRGKCKSCGERIHWRYPLVELLTGVGFALVAWTSSGLTDLLSGLVFFSLLLVLAFIDLDHKVLPNALTVPGLVIGLLFSLIGWTIPVVQSLAGAILGFGVIILIVLISKGGMGMGDAKLMALIGSFLGWIPVFYVLFWASALGAVVGIVYLYLTKQDRTTPVPFGPFLAVAALACFFFA